jgi:hypothetical protein|tara:strand:+ start:456 stop:560 length:105 start_codon:yes stop_codon:yes gene_type:complete
MIERIKNYLSLISKEIEEHLYEEFEINSDMAISE